MYVHIEGVSVHPGEGKDALINAALLLNEFINSLPVGETPYEAGPDDGYWHINNIEGSSDVIDMKMIIREFDFDKLEKRSNHIRKIAESIQAKYPKAKVQVTIKDQYENMRPYLDKCPKVVEVAETALRKNGITPVHGKIRGGTDGATFSKMGLPTPNLGTGSNNHHGRFEYLVVQDFLKMIDVVIDIMKI